MTSTLMSHYIILLLEKMPTFSDVRLKPPDGICQLSHCVLIIILKLIIASQSV